MPSKNVKTLKGMGLFNKGLLKLVAVAVVIGCGILLYTTERDCRAKDKEMVAIGSAASTIKESIAIPCTACHYCTDGCPMGICIPEYFAIYNSIKQFGKDQQWMNAITYYRNLSNTHGKASECLQCGQCEGHCPQQIPIIENLELVAQTFE